MTTHLIFDTELMGTHNPAFLICIEEYETGQRWSFWDENLSELVRMFNNPDYTWVGFNSAKFDMPVCSAVTDGVDLHTLKQIAQDAVNEVPPWTLAQHYDYVDLEIDHIDLFDVAPGVKISLKAYMARMGYPTLVDLPFDHTHDLTDSERKVVEAYCWNDIGGTKELFTRLRKAIDLRVQLSEQYGVDLRSKSDAQCAEAIFKTTLGLGKTTFIPRSVEYRAPDFVQTDSEIINDLIDKLEWEEFKINPENGSPIEPDWMEQPIQLGYGSYKFGLGGLHSTHDKQLYLTATSKMLISDFDVASYYPNIIMKAGIVPEFGGNKGAQFLEMYREIYERRMVAKNRAKKVKNEIKKIKALLQEQNISS